MSLFLVLVPSEFTARVRSRAATMDDLRGDLRGEVGQLVSRHVEGGGDDEQG